MLVAVKSVSMRWISRVLARTQLLAVKVFYRALSRQNVLGTDCVFAYVNELGKSRLVSSGSSVVAYLVQGSVTGLDGNTKKGIRGLEYRYYRLVQRFISG